MGNHFKILMPNSPANGAPGTRIAGSYVQEATAEIQVSTEPTVTLLFIVYNLQHSDCPISGEALQSLSGLCFTPDSVESAGRIANDTFPTLIPSLDNLPGVQVWFRYIFLVLSS